MVRGEATNIKIKQLIVKLFHDGQSFRAIGNKLNVPKSTVADIIKKYGETASLAVSAKKSGRPRKVTPRMQRMLVKTCKSGRRDTLRNILVKWNEETQVKLSRETCRRWIHKSGLHFYKAKEKPLVSDKQKKRRLAWAKERVLWTQDEWKKIIFSDESRFDVCFGDHRKRIIRNAKEAFNKDCLKRTIKFPPGVMVWGNMSAYGLGVLHFIQGTVNAQKYQNILETNLLPSLNKLAPEGNFVFQQDGASCHTAKSTKNWLNEHDITVLDWPANSPDLNIIETVWHKMKQALRNDPQRSVNDLKAKLQHIWDNFTPNQCEDLVKSMPNRIKAVIKAKGEATPY